MNQARSLTQMSLVTSSMIATGASEKETGIYQINSELYITFNSDVFIWFFATKISLICSNLDAELMSMWVVEQKKLLEEEIPASWWDPWILQDCSLSPEICFLEKKNASEGGLCGTEPHLDLSPPQAPS